MRTNGMDAERTMIRNRIALGLALAAALLGAAAGAVFRSPSGPELASASMRASPPADDSADEPSPFDDDTPADDDGS